MKYSVHTVHVHCTGPGGFISMQHAYFILQFSSKLKFRNRLFFIKQISARKKDIKMILLIIGFTYFYLAPYFIGKLEGFFYLPHTCIKIFTH